MHDPDVRRVTLAPMRVASARGFGPNPEEIAWDKLLSWAEAEGLLTEDSRFFGFNDPHPTPGSPDYGYEQWMVVGPETQATGDITIKDVPAGTYAVLRCLGLHVITETWRRLHIWYADRFGDRPVSGLCLEQCLSPPGAPPEDMVFDLHLPIAG